MLNYHCNVVSINRCGILIRGKSGSGKSSLSLGLIERGKARGWPSILVCDDQAQLYKQGECLMARVSESIAGMVELRGYGIVQQEYQPEISIRLVAEMVEDNTIERLPENLEYEELLDVQLPIIEVPIRHEEMAARIILAWVDDNIQ